jgi:rhodanese-related sulfurtransferase
MALTMRNATKTMIKWIPALLVLVGGLGTPLGGFADDRNLEPREHTKDSLKEVQEQLAAKKAVLVDVRDLVEWNDGHVKGAVFLPWRDLQDKFTEAEVKGKLPKEKILYTYCAVGYRSLRAAKILKKYGYEVRPLKPGFKELAEAGFATDNSPPAKSEVATGGNPTPGR